MANNRLINISLVFFLIFASCEKQLDYTKKPMISKDETNPKEKGNKLFVFVGEKISIKEIPSSIGSLDHGYIAIYKVLERIYGFYTSDSLICFYVYDHYGTPEFTKYKTVLLFVSKDGSKYYHEKYQYFDLYKTDDNKWASSYKPFDYNYSPNIKPLIINFKDQVSYNIKDCDTAYINAAYKSPYYKIINDTAYAVYGNYLYDLFQLKKDGVLKARGLF